MKYKLKKLLFLSMNCFLTTLVLNGAFLNGAELTDSPSTSPTHTSSSPPQTSSSSKSPNLLHQPLIIENPPPELQQRPRPLSFSSSISDTIRFVKYCGKWTWRMVTQDDYMDDLDYPAAYESEYREQSDDEISETEGSLQILESQEELPPEELSPHMQQLLLPPPETHADLETSSTDLIEVGEQSAVDLESATQPPSLENLTTDFNEFLRQIRKNPQLAKNVELFAMGLRDAIASAQPQTLKWKSLWFWIRDIPLALVGGGSLWFKKFFNNSIRIKF